MLEPVKLKLEVGRSYLNASGRIVDIIYFKDRYYWDEETRPYFVDGLFSIMKESRHRNLIREVPQELKDYLQVKIEEYYTKPSFQIYVDKTFKKEKLWQKMRDNGF